MSERKRSQVAAMISSGVLLACGFAGWATAAPGDVTVAVSPVADIQTGPNSSNPTQFEAVGSTVFFQANDGNAGIELFKSEPPYTSATLVEDINADFVTGSNPTSLTAVGTTLFFTAQPQTSGPGGTGRELWKSVPPYNAASTDIVADIRAGEDQGSDPQGLFNFNGTLLFSADSNPATVGRELWKSNGGPLGAGGTELVEDINTAAGAGSGPRDFTQLDATTVIFAATDADGTEVWRTNGTGGAGTAQVANIVPGPNGSFPTGFMKSGSNVFFTAEGDPGVDIELYKTDGAGATEIDVNDVNAGDSSNPETLADVGGTLYFKADDGVNGIELWKSNGGPLGPGGTEMVANINATGNSSPSELTNVNGIVFFRANDGIYGIELWRTAGTTATTARVSDINPGLPASSPANLTNVNGTLLFSASDGGVTGNEPWKATVSVEGPAPVTPAPPAKKKKCKKKKKKGKKGATAAKKCKKRKKGKSR